MADCRLHLPVQWARTGIKALIDQQWQVARQQVDDGLSSEQHENAFDHRKRCAGDRGAAIYLACPEVFEDPRKHGTSKRDIALDRLPSEKSAPTGSAELVKGRVWITITANIASTWNAPTLTSLVAELAIYAPGRRGAACLTVVCDAAVLCATS